MAKSLSDLRSNPQGVRWQATVRVCLRPDLLAEVQRLGAELREYQPANDDEDRDGPPGRVGGLPRSVKNIQDRLSDLLKEIEENENDLGLRGNLTDGEWRRWVDEHPPRAEGEPGFERDADITENVCNADALIEDLGLFVHAWNEEPAGRAEWDDLLAPNIGNPDKGLLASTVYAKYEVRLDVPKWRSGLSANLRTLSAFDSPAVSASRTNGSTAGSPFESSTG